MSDRTGMGRRAAPDARDKQYPLRVPKVAAIRSRIWNANGVLDQGATPQCVAYAGTKYLNAGPIAQPAPWLPLELYQRCQVEDEWPGEDYEGTSVRALFKVLKAAGYIGEYRWAFDAETIVNQVLAAGPVVMGTEWLYEMFVPDRWGYIQAKGDQAGGHAWLVLGAYRDRQNPDGTKGAVRMLNSWGTGWGLNGRAWLTFGDLDKLVKDAGEACVATEVKFRTKTVA